MDTSIAEELYDQLIEINRKAFIAGFFDTASHALMSAIECAEKLGSDQPLKDINSTALQQLEWINTHIPDNKHSTLSSIKRDRPESGYSMVSKQANFKIRLRLLKQPQLY